MSDQSSGPNSGSRKAAARAAKKCQLCGSALELSEAWSVVVDPPGVGEVTLVEHQAGRSYWCIDCAQRKVVSYRRAIARKTADEPSDQSQRTPAEKAWATRRARGDDGRAAARKAVETRRRNERGRPAGTEANGARPDPSRLLGSLKDFQRQTVEHVHRRFFLDHDTTNRFLVADEVGLGKTLVARGVTALALDHLWEETERLDVIYVCSNAEIAAQNLKRLRVNDDDYAKPTRLTLLPREIHGLKERKLNFVSLTPGTSFDPHSSMGVSKERVVLYLLCRQAWGFKRRRKGPLNVLCGRMRRARFESWVDWIESEGDIDESLAESFIASLAADERNPGGDGSLRERFYALIDGPFQRGQRDRVDDEAKAAQRELIRDLRTRLARTCVRALEPDLIILDEFQRFKHLLTEESEAGELARHLFDYQDTHTDETAKTLLLSATPYKAYSTTAELDASGQYEDFVATVDFLLEDEGERSGLREDLEMFRSRLLRWDEDSLERIGEVKRRIEGRLRGGIARTERLAASADRNGMLAQVPSHTTELKDRDLDGYVLAQEIAELVDQPDPVEYWKSSPYLLNLMDDYKLKREFNTVLKRQSAQGNAIRAALRNADRCLLNASELRAYEELDPGNARMRALVSDLLDEDAWRLLWLSPSLPYYQPAGAYGKDSARALTKRLVFSSWTVVPKAISLVLSYEAERRMMKSGNPTAVNDAATRRNRGSLLRISFDKGRLVGMPVLALMYPSFALAEAVDPAMLATESGEPPTVSAALKAVRRALSERLREVTTGVPRRGEHDPRWYWAAPLLLDAQLDQAAARALPRVDAVRKLARSTAESAEEGGWELHLDEAERALTGTLDPPLGRPPSDLADVVGRLAIAAPGIGALRALTRGADSDSDTRDAEVRTEAMRVGWAFRSLFNAPDVSELIRGEKRDGIYWQQVLGHCLDGCLQAVLDEFAHVEREFLGHVGVPVTPEVIKDVATGMAEAITIRPSHASVDVYETGDTVTVESERMRSRFALRFGEQHAEDGATLARSDQVRTAFNSPFWPFVLASTSVGQEGLDFHLYCHALTHWNLPSNPVDLEQREGRVHRYKGHAIRRNLARAHGEAVLAEGSPDPWTELFERGGQDRPEGQSELWPYWIYPGSGNGNGERWARIERHVLTLPLSRDETRLTELLRSLTLYRSVLGQARQEDLVHLISERVPPDRQDEVAELLRIDLSPPAREPLDLPPPRPLPEPSQEAPPAAGEEVWDAPEWTSSPLPGVREQWPAYADMAVVDVLSAYELGSDKFAGLLEDLARHPDEPRRYMAIETHLRFPKGAVPGLLGGYANRSKRLWNRRRPFHIGRDAEDYWWMWMDAERAAALVAHVERGGAPETA